MRCVTPLTGEGVNDSGDEAEQDPGNARNEQSREHEKGQGNEWDRKYEHRNKPRSLEDPGRPSRRETHGLTELWVGLKP